MPTIKGGTWFDKTKKFRSKRRGFITVELMTDDVMDNFIYMNEEVDIVINEVTRLWLQKLRKKLLEDTKNQRGSKLPPWKKRTGSLIAGHVIRQTGKKNWSLIIDAAENPKKAKKKGGRLDYAAVLESSREWAWVKKGVDIQTRLLKPMFKEALEDLVILEKDKRRRASIRVTKIRRERAKINQDWLRDQNITEVDTPEKEHEYFDIQFEGESESQRYIAISGMDTFTHGAIRSAKGRFVKKGITRQVGRVIRAHKRFG